MDLRRHRAGLATASGDDLVSLPLGTPPQQIVDRLRSLVLPGSTAPSLMDLMTNAETMIAGRRPDSLGVVVLITNAAALHAHSIRDQESATAALAVAKRLRADGVQLFAVLIPGTDRRTTTPESTWAWLTTITGSRQRVYEADGPAQIERLGNQIYSQIRTLAGTSLAGSLTIHDEMAPDIALLPGTADGSPLEGPDWLIWRRGLLPASGITLSYRIRPQKVGLLPTNRFAVADYTDVDGQRRSVAFPLPRIEVIAPSPTPTSTASPSPTGPPTSTPRPRPLYLPLLSLRHCLARPRIHLGLERARGLLAPPNPGRRSVILLLTDGRSDPDPASLAIAQARAAQADGIVVVAVGLGADIDRASLEQMASPGQFHLAPDAEDLAGVYRRLAAAMPCLP
ncbi:MAG: VWA domain-containing protein [Ardenticatenia bacterium]|nr:VWA domain-containing protein [Ardenticatenia bacterium]